MADAVLLPSFLTNELVPSSFLARSVTNKIYNRCTNIAAVDGMLSKIFSYIEKDQTL